MPSEGSNIKLGKGSWISVGSAIAIVAISISAYRWLDHRFDNLERHIHDQLTRSSMERWVWKFKVDNPNLDVPELPIPVVPPHSHDH